MKKAPSKRCFKMKTNIKSLGISLISFKKTKRLEFFYIHLKNLSFLYKDELGFPNFQFKLQQFTVNNNIDVMSKYPVLITSNMKPEKNEFFLILNLTLNQQIQTNIL